MCASFSDDDVGKTVVNASGNEVGIVSAVEHDTIRVKPNPGIADTIKAALGWEGTGEDTYPLQDDAIERVTDDEIRLSGELHEGGESPTGTSPGRTDTGTGTEHGTGAGSTGVGSVDADRDDDSGLMDSEGDDELIDTDIGDDSGVIDSDEPHHEEGLSGDAGEVRTGDSPVDEPPETEMGRESAAGGRDERSSGTFDRGTDEDPMDTDVGSGDDSDVLGSDRDDDSMLESDRGDDSGLTDSDDDELIDTDIGDDEELIDTDIGDDDDELLDSDSDSDRRSRDDDEL